jgi:hypothetical protein
MSKFYAGNGNGALKSLQKKKPSRKRFILIILSTILILLILSVISVVIKNRDNSAVKDKDAVSYPLRSPISTNEQRKKILRLNLDAFQEDYASNPNISIYILLDAASNAAQLGIKEKRDEYIKAAEKSAASVEGIEKDRINAFIESVRNEKAL